MLVFCKPQHQARRRISVPRRSCLYGLWGGITLLVLAVVVYSENILIELAELRTELFALILELIGFQKLVKRFCGTGVLGNIVFISFLVYYGNWGSL